MRTYSLCLQDKVAFNINYPAQIDLSTFNFLQTQILKLWVALGELTEC